MAILDDILALPGQNGARRQAAPANIQATRTKRASSGGVSFDAFLDKLESIEDPGNREIMRSFMEAHLSRLAGRAISIPTREETAMQEIQGQQQLRAMQITAAEQQTRIAKAAVMSLGANVLAAYGVSGKDMDAVIEGNPELFLGLANDEAGVPLSKFELTLAGQDVVITEEESRGRVLERQKQDITAAEQTEKLAEKALPQAEKQFQAIRSGFAEQADVNLGTGLSSDIDTTAGSEQFVASIGQALSGTTFSPAVMADAILQDSGGNIQDQLEGLATDELGQLVVGHGDAGVEDDATFYLTAALVRLAGAKDKPVSEVMRQVGLPYSGVNWDAFEAAAVKLAGAKGERPEALLQATLGTGGLLRFLRDRQVSRAVGDGGG
jgi:hypothetical protein